MATFRDLGRHVGTACLAGVIAGVLVGGLLGRVVMRVSGFAAGPALVGVRTSNGNRVGDITLEGTLGLVVFVGLAAGLLGGALYAVLEPWLRRIRPWHGLAYGAALLATFGFTVLDPFNFDFNRFGPLALNVTMFAALFLVFGVCTAWLFDRLREIAARPEPIGRVVEVASWLALAPAALATALLAVNVAGPGGDPLLLIVMGGGLLLAAIAHWRGLPRPLGYAGLAAGLVLGGARTFDAIQLFRGF